MRIRTNASSRPGDRKTVPAARPRCIRQLASVQLLVDSPGCDGFPSWRAVAE
jgi:hypothetical protein